MKTIKEIIKVTECTREQAEKLHDELTNCRRIWDHLYLIIWIELMH